MGLLRTIAFHSPGVNAWATQKSVKFIVARAIPLTVPIQQRL